MAVLGRQLQQTRRLFLFFNFRQTIHKIPGILCRHFAISLPLQRRQARGRHLAKRRLHKLIEKILISLIATAIKPLMIWKLVLDNTVALSRE